MYDGPNGIPDYEYFLCYFESPMRGHYVYSVWERFSSPTPHKGGRVLDVGGIRLEEEEFRLTGEISWIPYNSTIPYSVYVIMMMLPYCGLDSLHDFVTCLET